MEITVRQLAATAALEIAQRLHTDCVVAFGYPNLRQLTPAENVELLRLYVATLAAELEYAASFGEAAPCLAADLDDSRAELARAEWALAEEDDEDQENDVCPDCGELFPIGAACHPVTA